MTTPQPKSSTLFTERNLLILILATVAGALMGWLTWLTIRHAAERIDGRHQHFRHRARVPGSGPEDGILRLRRSGRAADPRRLSGVEGAARGRSGFRAAGQVEVALAHVRGADGLTTNGRF